MKKLSIYNFLFLIFYIFLSGCSIKYEQYTPIKFDNKYKGVIIFNNNNTKGIIEFNGKKKNEINFQNKEHIKFNKKNAIIFDNKKYINFDNYKTNNIDFNNEKLGIYHFSSSNGNKIKFNDKKYLKLKKNNLYSSNDLWDNKEYMDLKRIKKEQEKIENEKKFIKSVYKLIFDFPSVVTNILMIPFDEAIEEKYSTKNIYKKQNLEKSKAIYKLKK